jgi:hypothetical protein
MELTSRKDCNVSLQEKIVERVLVSSPAGKDLKGSFSSKQTENQ